MITVSLICEAKFSPREANNPQGGLLYLLAIIVDTFEKRRHSIANDNILNGVSLLLATGTVVALLIKIEVASYHLCL